MKDHIKALLDCEFEFCIDHFGWQIYKLHNLTYQIQFDEDGEDIYKTFNDVDDAVDFFLSKVEKFSKDES